MLANLLLAEWYMMISYNMEDRRYREREREKERERERGGEEGERRLYMNQSSYRKLA